MNYQNHYLNEEGIHPGALKLISEAHEDVKHLFYEIEERAQYHQSRILNIFAKHRVSQRHFTGTTGYGYGDDGRDTLDLVFKDLFECEDALVRPQWVSGTHVISDGLFALLRPGDTILSITGEPYDTLHDVIGIKKCVSGSLKEWKVNYRQIELTSQGSINHKEIEKELKDSSVKIILIQRSKGYSTRRSLTTKEIGESIDFIKQLRTDVFVLVDNCYGEFTEDREPSSTKADLVVGSLIKNPGGGLAPTGAYAAGTREAIRLLSYRLTSPGIGREVGSNPAGYQYYYQGLFMAPHIVAEALKGAILSAGVFDRLKYGTFPHWAERRSDIIQSIEFNSSEELIAYCRAIQSASPVEGYVVPFPWEMPGYDHQVIMAAGTFVQGSSIELSADAPIKKPYIAYMQGGLTYAHVKIALMRVLTAMQKEGYIQF
ncbi:MAG: aminotransferase class I/II-fold pyridoxal phosphate-dependent enzyme [Caldicoprobacterales bacterium]|jgi:cystathionine beta-lyase family protein involved in aluminum resistance